MRRRSRARRALGRVAAGLVAVGVTAGALAGCTSGDDPTPTPTPRASSTSASPSPTPTPSPTETSTIPAAAREKSEKGAEAFVRYFFDQVNVAWTEPKAGIVKALGEAGCEFCSNIEETAQFLVREKQRYKQTPLSVSKVEAFTGAPENQAYLAIEGTQNRAQIVDVSGNVLATDPRKAVRFSAAVKWTADGWLVVGVEKAA